MDQSAGADFLQLDPDRAPAKGLTRWLAEAVRTAITDGQLPPGTYLPPTRALAEELRFSRGVIVEVYRRLGEEGLVSAQRGVGTVVLPREVSPGRPPRPVPAPMLLPRGATGGIDLSPGLPDLSAFPRAAWLRAERRALAAATPADLGYGDPRGHAWLRTELAAWLGRQRGLRIHPDDIIVVAGVAQSLALLTQAVRACGTTAMAVEDPGSRGARDEIAHWGVRPVPVAVDEGGLRVDELVHSGLRHVMITPAHQFPTGVVMAPHRRRALLDWVTPDTLVIEDDYDAEYRYDRAPVPALHVHAPDRIAYTGSTSKTLAPGLRIGWLVPPARMHAELLAAKHASDLGISVLTQLTLAQLLASGDYDRHIRLVRARHRRRRDALLAALRADLPRADVHGVAAGLHLLVTLPYSGVSDVEIAESLDAVGVIVHPLSWHRQRPGRPGFVLGYAANTPDRLRQAVARLAETATLGGTVGQHPLPVVQPAAQHPVADPVGAGERVPVDGS